MNYSSADPSDLIMAYHPRYLGISSNHMNYFEGGMIDGVDVGFDDEFVHDNHEEGFGSMSADGDLEWDFHEFRNMDNTGSKDVTDGGYADGRMGEMDETDEAYDVGNATDDIGGANETTDIFGELISIR